MRAPDAPGQFARAWEVPLQILDDWIAAHVEKAPPGILRNRVAMWYVNGQGTSQHDHHYHSLSAWWMLALDRLTLPYDEREEPKPGVKLYPEAEFEIIGWTLAEKPDVNGRSLYRATGAYDLWHQGHGVTELQAEEILRAHVWAIVNGRTDPRRDWIDQNREALNGLYSDFHAGKFGGPVRPGLEVDPYTKRFTGRERG